MSRINSLFEEDIEMMDALEDKDLNDNSEAIILQAMESRVYPDSEKMHLFENETVDEDGLTPEEEREFMIAMLDDEDDTLIDEEIDNYIES